MSFVLLIVLLAVVAGIALVAAGRGGSMPDVEPDRAPSGVLPGGPVGRAEVERLRFTPVLRGYRMDEVDEVLDRLVEQIELQQARLAELERAVPKHGPAAAAAEEL